MWLAGYIIIKGLPYLSPRLFEWEYSTENVSMLPAIVVTVLMVILALLFAAPVGMGAAIYLVEYARKGSRLVSLVRLTTESLAGIPSIVYGLFGFLLFVVACGMGFSILGGALTLAIMVLPLIMRTTEEALKSVPDNWREGSFALGAGRLRNYFLCRFACCRTGNTFRYHPFHRAHQWGKAQPCCILPGRSRPFPKVFFLQEEPCPCICTRYFLKDCMSTRLMPRLLCC